MIEELIKEISKNLRDQNLTLSTAESCTGGYISHNITNSEGSSDFFEGGFVTYTKASKIRDLRIDLKILEHQGIYSRETAEAMADAIRRIFGTSIGLSTTGIAPPGDKQTTEKTGKLVIGISTKKGINSKEIVLQEETRQDFKEKATKEALILLKKEIEK